jgi:FkbM family methyltransferase
MPNIAETTGRGRRIAARLLRRLALSPPVDGMRGAGGARTLYYRLQDAIWKGTRRSIWEIEGSKMYLDPWAQSPLRSTYRSYLSGPNEPLTTRLFKASVRPGDTVIDIGANVGFYTLLAARLVGSSGRVYAFEPEPRNFEILCRNISLNAYSHVTPRRCAVWRRDGQVNLYLSNDRDTGAHTLRARHAMKYFDSEEGGNFAEVDCVTLDAVLDKSMHVDVIKMDIEGAEAGALEGMSRTIRNSQRLKIFTEFYPRAVREMGDSPELFLANLMEYGFSATLIDEFGGGGNKVRPARPEEVLSVCERSTIVNLLLTR